MTTQDRIARVFRDDPSPWDGKYLRPRRGGHSYTFGCDGKMILAVREEPAASLDTGAQGTEAAIGNTIAWVEDDDRDPIDIDAADLRAFCGPARFAPLGIDEPEVVREGVILGEVFNLNRLAKLLIGAVGPVRLVLIPHMRMLSVRGADFVATLMAYSAPANPQWPSLP